MPTGLLDSGGSGGGTTYDTTDTTDATNAGDLINDVRARIAGYDQQIEESAPGAETNDIEVTTTDSGATVIDPDTTNSTDDLVGVTTTEDQVTVVSQSGEGTTTTTADRATVGGDSTSVSNQAAQAANQLGIGQPLAQLTSWLQENAQVVGAVAGVATLASVAGVFGGD